MRVVQKFGGSSVRDAARIAAVAARSLARRRAGDEVVVVVSAMAGETDRLIGLANTVVAGEPQGASTGAGAGWTPALGVGDAEHERELSVLLSTGEQASAALLAMAIQRAGGQARSLVGPQLGLHTDGAFTNARIRALDAATLRRELAAGRVVVCAGFQGVDADGNLTTLGRGGSDTSAVALAVAIGAEVCEILTDVDGVYTTDPRVVPEARKLERICFEEMLELASLGAKVLQIRSVEFAMKHGVRLHVRSSLHEGEGTWIVPEEESMEAVVVRGVALERNEAKLTVTRCPDVPGTVAQIFGTLAEQGVVVDMIIQNASVEGRTDVTFTVPRADLPRSERLLQALDFVDPAQGVELRGDPEIAKISVVGVGMRSHSGVAARAFAALARAGINVQMVSTSEIKISVVVAAKHGEEALRCLHAAFELDGGAAPA